MDRKATKPSTSAGAASTSGVKVPKRLQSGINRPVNVASANEKVWLVKVPKYLAQQWLSPQYENEAVIARLTRLVDAQGKSRFRLKPVPTLTNPRLSSTSISAQPIKKEPSSVRLSGASSHSSGIDVYDREYEFLINPVKEKDPSMVILCEGSPPVNAANTVPAVPISDSKQPRGHSAQLLGVVSAKVDCRTCQVDQQYMKRLREEFTSANKPKGEIKLIEDIKPTFKPVADHEHNIMYKQKKKLEGKNIRRDEDDVKSDLFRAFERHQYYKISDLVEITKQPPPYLKKILEDIADYNVKPPYKNMWELKPQFRHYLAQQPNKDAS